MLEYDPTDTLETMQTDDLESPWSDIDRKSAVEALPCDDVGLLSRTLLLVVLNEEDRSWAEDFVAAAFLTARGDALAMAVTSVGHLARLNGVIDLDRFYPLICSVARNSGPLVRGRVRDTIDDFMEWFPELLVDFPPIPEAQNLG